MKKLALCLLACSCVTGGGTPTRDEVRQEIADGLKNSAPFLPSPFNYLAVGAGALVAAMGGHQTAKRAITKAAKVAQAATKA